MMRVVTNRESPIQVQIIVHHQLQNVHRQHRSVSKYVQPHDHQYRHRAPAKKNSDTGPAVKTSTFIKTRYIKTGAVGIRERGGRQVMQILPVTEYSYSGEHMKTADSWADTCISKLERGESIDDVKKWVVKQKKPLLDAVAAARSALGNALVNGQAD